MKTWITNSPIADVFVVWAKLEEDSNRIRGFVLEKGMKGLTAPSIDGKFSLRASTTGMIMMDNVFVPEENMFPEISGLMGPFGCPQPGRATASRGDPWVPRNSAGTRRVSTSSTASSSAARLAANQLIQKKLADMQTEISLGLQGSLRVGQTIDEGTGSSEAISLVKRNNCGKALDIARVARDMHGANGIVDEYHVIRHVLNLESVKHLRRNPRRARSDSRSRPDGHPSLHGLGAPGATTQRSASGSESREDAFSLTKPRNRRLIAADGDLWKDVVCR